MPETVKGILCAQGLPHPPGSLKQNRCNYHNLSFSLEVSP